MHDQESKKTVSYVTICELEYVLQTQAQKFVARAGEISCIQNFTETWNKWLCFSEKFEYEDIFSKKTVNIF